MAISYSNAKIGAFLAYLLIILNAVYGLIVYPFILHQVGVVEYGVYKTIASFTGTIAILDFGLGGAMMRYISRYLAEKKEELVPNYLALCVFQLTIIIIVVSSVIFLVFYFIDDLFGKGLSPEELVLAKKLYVLFAIKILLHIGENFFMGIITGYNQFPFSNTLKIGTIITRTIATFILLTIMSNTIIIVSIDIGIVVLSILVEILFITKKIHVRVKYSRWDSGLFAESLKYMVLLFITSIVAEANSNLDNVIIGAIAGAAIVTVYSYALLLFSMFQQLSVAISGVMLPLVTESIVNDDDKYSNTISLVVKTGRLQFMLLGAVAMGFVVVGKPFIHLWLGEGETFDDVYYLSLILFLPAILELCVNICIAILRAQNLLGFRTVVLFVSTALNVAITFIGVLFWNYYAAAIGTAISFLLGSVIVMNVYYHKKFGFNMLEIYKAIFRRTWLCIAISGIVSFCTTLCINNDLLYFCVGAISFCTIYIMLMWKVGLNSFERIEIRRTVRTIIRIN